MLRDKIHINCDMAESYGKYLLVDDLALLPHVHACNIACGMHAGDPIVIDRVIKAAVEAGKEIGAHPGYPDLQGFGRRWMRMSTNDLYSYVKYQVATIKGITESWGGKMTHVKPHGALYNHAAKDKDTALAIVRAVHDIDQSLHVYTLPNSEVMKTCTEMGMMGVPEGFMDRRYHADGSLTSRQREDAVIHDPKLAWTQAKQLWHTQSVDTVDGTSCELQVETICIHGDHPHSLAILQYQER